MALLRSFGTMLATRTWLSDAAFVDGFSLAAAPRERDKHGELDHMVNDFAAHVAMQEYKRGLRNGCLPITPEPLTSVNSPRAFVIIQCRLRSCTVSRP
jgi:hypothetical protein